MTCYSTNIIVSGVARNVNNFKSSDFSYQGAHLFSTFRRFHLKEQQRSVNDALHCNLVSKFDKGEKIDPQNRIIYKHLSAECLASGPDWQQLALCSSTCGNKSRTNQYHTTKAFTLGQTSHNPCLQMESKLNQNCEPCFSYTDDRY
jgi:hypothetical protein